jgi:catechol 2,3-dioxygenase-like lactoylglutathione lyase family enzyme
MTANPPVEQFITFLYTTDLTTSAQFYEEMLGLELVRDQGTCRIYRVSGDGFLGICQRDSVPDDKRNIIVTIVTPDVDGWYAALQARGVTFEKAPETSPKYNIYHCFLRDPNGYLLEIQRFLD